MIQVDKVYLISKGTFKPANKKFNNTNHDYECTLGMTSAMEMCQDDSTIAKQTYTFIKISEIANIEVGLRVDICGVITQASNAEEITVRRDNSTTLRRNLTIVDDSNTSITVTMWGNQANQFSEEQLVNHPIISCKNMKVGDFNGKNLGASGAYMELDADNSDSHNMRAWYNSNKDTLQATPISSGGASAGAYDLRPRKPMNSIETENMGHNEKPDFITARATVVFIRHDGDRNPWYDSCPETKKKVMEQSDGNWFCEATNKYMPQCVRRYVMSMQIADNTASQWVSAFDNEGQAILGKSADELNESKCSGDDDGYEQVFNDATWERYLVGLRVKSESYQEQERIKATFFKLWPMDYKIESEMLLQEIAQYGVQASLPQKKARDAEEGSK